MKMRPRKYGTLNRSIARATSHAVNNYYRRKNRNKNYNNEYNSQTENQIKSFPEWGIVEYLGVICFVIFMIMIAYSCSTPS